MYFCPQCDSVMLKNTTPTGGIIYNCRCQNSIDGTSEDTLMSEGYIESAKSCQKHMVFIENSAHDTAGNVVNIDCGKCGLDFMTLIRVGENETTMYTCSCGNVITHAQHMSNMKKNKK